MIKTKLINVRKAKEFAQGAMARELHMTQSQYQRREKGEIMISDPEWEKMAKILHMNIEDIKEDEPGKVVNNLENNKVNYFGSNNYFYNIPEFILENQQDYINLLKKEIEELKEENRTLKEKLKDI
ncbi:MULTISPECIES: helix-turn-helix transcriptional regulator [Chryseobacterium]|uniref:Transcriptional regulator with XRE-family HTH domain n=1 Tax=Chryseobacterium camelliae TaxID=1265445 RepID=A0ABU0TNV7_9FLAO|nr:MULTISPECIES: helix-turn-helix transcriptional regulator [Chryseobacterium]MDT3407428.1 transcriptional regulator with XRE-family HTH domain [Pseudacidovorax intermedius]MDQ1098722.1 transcriptional regulator with XRE-family HTH domain [Chryseobacterium camelliae]MDQ1102648.1 transcriptional regulator with XRE-family HTH domain [Chryseobacterium sp. SORGH_AS_1048]MDR6086077.1 transcriptional regulator with XRE-family HTH domain [Chryseobacterium sp. SORGH_AS_0909]MDR6130446.1 transcriptiona